MINKYNDYDIVSYNGVKYIVRLIYNTDGTISYSLYTLDGKLFKENVQDNLLTFVDNYNDYFTKLKKKNNNNKTDSSNHSSSSGKSYGGGNRNNNATTSSKTENGTKDLSDAIGTVDKTEETLKQCKNIINEAKTAVSGANLTLETWDDVNNSQGLATDASITFLCNMVDSLNTIEKNLENNKKAANALHKLNISLKQLLIKFTEKKQKEKERDAKKAQYDAEPETITETDSDGNEKQVPNPKKSELKRELDAIVEELNKINSEIDTLQNEIDYQYKIIREKYGDLINFGSMFKKSDTIFGTAGSNRSSSGSSMDVDMVDGYTCELYNYNGLKYFLYLPEGVDSYEDLPVHVYLRGAGEFGKEISGSGLDALLKRNSSPITPKAIIMCPVTNASADGESSGRIEYADKIKGAIDDVVESYNADTNRVSISGHSSGARAAMCLANRYPDYFSAVVPVSDANTHYLGSNCKYWGISGADDEYVKRLKQCHSELGDNFNLTLINGEGHDIENFALTSQYEIDGEVEYPLIWAIKQSKA